MTYVVTLYVERGSLDGETLACGPYEDRTTADAEMNELHAYGQADVQELAPHAGVLVRRIEEAA